MKENVIYIPSFQGEYKTGLIFSMIDGLKVGSDLKIICDQSPVDLERLLEESGIKNMSWSSYKKGSDCWELKIHKNEIVTLSNVGCCGMCGGNSNDQKGG